jgi:outer membrane beta-barrel protein
VRSAASGIGPIVHDPLRIDPALTEGVRSHPVAGSRPARRRAISAGLLALIVVGLAPGAGAQERPSTTPPPTSSCLDQSIVDELGQTLRRRGVQQKPFLRKGRIQFFGRGGLYASDLFSSSYAIGGGAAWWPVEDFALELTIDGTHVALDLDAPLADFFGDARFRPGPGYLALVSGVWSPVHFKLRTGGGKIIHGDASLAVGFGRLFHETSQGLAFDGGLLVELYVTRWLSLRIDVRDVVLIQEAVGETRLTNNVIATLGLGFWVPFGF